MSQFENVEVIIENEALAKALNASKGDSVKVKCKNGVPVEREWRNRFKDAEVDGCISFPQNKVKGKQKSSGGDE